MHLNLCLNCDNAHLQLFFYFLFTSLSVKRSQTLLYMFGPFWTPLHVSGWNNWSRNPFSQGCNSHTSMFFSFSQLMSKHYTSLVGGWKINYVGKALFPCVCSLGDYDYFMWHFYVGLWFKCIGKFITSHLNIRFICINTFSQRLLKMNE